MWGNHENNSIHDCHLGGKSSTQVTLTKAVKTTCNIFYSFPLSPVLFISPLTFYKFPCILRSGSLYLFSSYLASYKQYHFFLFLLLFQPLVFFLSFISLPRQHANLHQSLLLWFLQHSRTLDSFNILNKVRNI